LDAVVAGEARRVAPVRDRFLLPLPLEHVEELGRPRGRHPVGMRGGVGVAGTAGEGDDDRDVELVREADGLPKELVVLARRLRVRVERIAVARERADRQPRVLELVPERVRAAVALQQRVHVEMIAAGPSAGPELQRLNLPERSNLVDHLLLRERAEHGREQPQLHDAVTLSRTAVQTAPARWLSRTASTMQAAR